MAHWMEDTTERAQLRWSGLRKLLKGKGITDEERNELERFNKAEWYTYSDDMGFKDALEDLGKPDYVVDFDGEGFPGVNIKELD